MTDTKKINVLHIDDDREFLELFRRTYSEEFDVTSLSGGAEVLELLARGEADALVLDYEMPGKKGLEVLREVRQMYPTMPVVFYTGQGDEEVARQAFTAGATDYFVKAASDFAQKEKVVNSVRKAVEKCAVEEKLAEQQAMLEGIIEYNPYSISIFDSRGRFIRSNGSHTKLFGMSPCRQGIGDIIVFDDVLAVPEYAKELMQRQWLEIRDNYSCFEDPSLMDDEEWGRLLPLWKKGEIIKSPTIWYRPPTLIEGTCVKPKCVSATAFSIKNSRGEIVQYINMHEDITARIVAEEAAKQAHVDLQKAHDDLRKAYESVEQKVVERTAELEDFAHMVSHDLRNNLFIIEKLAERGTLHPDEVQSIHGEIIANTVSLRDFVERLLFLARAGKAIALKEKVPPALLARAAFEALEAAHPDAELHIDPSLPMVLCDPDALGQVFSNLFTNALAHGIEGVKTVIDVGYQVKEEGLEITVRDNGAGIVAEDLPRLFDVTFTTGGTGRFGFGLAIVKKLVEAHGGSVRAESEGSGKGAAFVITLPRE
jgi:signal transduction histidine kinase/FixJ family two-component response regulator